MRFKDKIVMITGAGKGIGRNSALLFAKEGAIPVICDIDEKALDATREEFKTLDSRFECFRLDVTKKEEVNQVMNSIEQKYGELHVLVNNAGITRDNLLLRMEEKAFEDVINVNLKGTFLCGQAAAKLMMKKKTGRIINTASIVGIYGNFGQSNYSASKGAIIAMTKTWAKELGRYNITVNAVAPGFIQTEMTNNLPEKALTMMKERIVLSRLGEPEDVSKVYMFLASNDAAYITGTIINVDGGLVV